MGSIKTQAIEGNVLASILNGVTKRTPQVMCVREVTYVSLQSVA